MKKVSIIIPCYNQGKFVEDAINSALNQTYKNIEIICINDCSTDNSKEIIENLKEKLNFKFIDLKENKGVINARNTAIDASTGEYILPLDADDTIEPTYIEKAVEVLNNNPDVGIVYCKARFFGKRQDEWVLPEYNFEDFLYSNCIFNCALYRKSDFYHAGKYKENMKDGCEDWDLWVSIVGLNLKPYRINEILHNYRWEENARTHSANKNTEWFTEIIRNNINTYLKSKTFIKKIFFNENIFMNETQRLNKKLKNYKKRYTITIALCIIELIAIIFFLIK